MNLSFMMRGESLTSSFLTMGLMQMLLLRQRIVEMLAVRLHLSGNSSYASHTQHKGGRSAYARHHRLSCLPFGLSLIFYSCPTLFEESRQIFRLWDSRVIWYEKGQEQKPSKFEAFGL